jgi:hypothetical protein
LWPALLTVGVNAVVGALRGYEDDSRPWDVVGVHIGGELALQLHQGERLELWVWPDRPASRLSSRRRSPVRSMWASCLTSRSMRVVR